MSTLAGASVPAAVISKGKIRGSSNAAIKTAFKIVKGLKPGFIPDAIDGLLDDFIRQIEPFFDSWKAGGGARPLREHFVTNGPAVADALLSITDARAARNSHKTVVATYNRLRPKAKENVVAAMPRVGDLIAKHAADV